MSSIEVNSLVQQITPALREVTPIRVMAVTQTLIIDSANRSVSVVLGGPPGPRGPMGPPSQGIPFEHIQDEPSTSWLMEHNFGYPPIATVLEAGTGKTIIASEIHHSDNQMELQFNKPRAGIARLR